MSWQDRIRDSKIVAADGQEFEIETTDIPQSRTDRAVIFTFSEFNGDYVQKLSAGGNSFSFTLWFSGPDHDLTAKAFEEATKDTRPVLFFHPLHKKPFRCAVLSLKRNDRLVTAANETAFDIAMHETISGRRPENTENSIVKVDNISIAASENAADNFVGVVEIKTSLQTGLAGQETLVPFGVDDSIFPLSETKNELDKITAAVASTINEFYGTSTDFLAEAEGVRFSALSLISTIESAPKSAALVVRGYIGLVGKTSTDLARLTPKSRVEYYQSLKGSLVMQDITNYELLFPALVIGVCQGSIIAKVDDFSTREEVFNVVDTIYEWSVEFFARLDAVIISDELNSYEPDLDAIKEMLSIVAITANKLEELIFQLKQERSVTVTQIKDLYSLVYELLGATSIDDLQEKVENFMLINNIRGTDVFQVEPGTELIYYT